MMKQEVETVGMPSNDLSKKSWYLVYSKPREESTALENLQFQGYECYLPLIKNKRRRRSKYIQVIEPLFPRYLFILLDKETDNWAPIRSTIGVTSIVQFGYVPAKVPNDFICYLKTNEDQLGYQCFQIPELKRGDSVEIIEGSMSGYTGVFMAKSSKERVNILLKIMGNTVIVQIPEDYIGTAPGV